MPCYRPLNGFRSCVVNPTGKRSIVFGRGDGFADLPVTLPCGQCIGCRLERARQWAVRICHESSLYESNCFVTLTYAPGFLPQDGSLNLRHFQLFMKRLRREFGSGIRFFHCGEYGENFGRPHYHAILFNLDFPDKTLIPGTDPREFTSEVLDGLWGLGFARIGSVTFDSACYVARYCTKKVTGERALAHYCEFSDITGEIFREKRPEYSTMSRRPGIGRPWLDRFGYEVLNNDSVVMNGREMRPPKFYDSRFEVLFPDELEANKSARARAGYLAAWNNSLQRLRVREDVAVSKFNLSIRSYEK